MSTPGWPWIALLLLTVQAAGAQTVWRCGSEGRVFSDRPCSEGQALPATRSPSAQETQAAQQVATRERRLADALRQERLERARIAPGSGLVAIGPASDDAVLPGYKPHKPRAEGTRPKRSDGPKDRADRAEDDSRETRETRTRRGDRAEPRARARKPPVDGATRQPQEKPRARPPRPAAGT